MSDKIAESVRLVQGVGIEIDGIPFPFAVSQDVEIDAGGPGELTVVTLRLFVHGTTVYSHGERRQVVDRELGDVGTYARNLVRAGLLERLPWLAAS